jgi:hypothetical protein
LADGASRCDAPRYGGRARDLDDGLITASPQSRCSRFEPTSICVRTDPFDRMLVAQTKFEGLTLVTRDSDIQRYDVDLLVV